MRLRGGENWFRSVDFFGSVSSYIHPASYFFRDSETTIYVQGRVSSLGLQIGANHADSRKLSSALPVFMGLARAWLRPRDSVRPDKLAAESSCRQ
mgnify:CR=1 FL=1